MGALFSAVIAKIVALAAWIAALVVAIFIALWDFVRDAVCWPFEQIMELVLSAVSAFDFVDLTSSFGVWGSLPAEIINILALLGVGTATSIIIAAITIRLGLQLIPFVRLGS